MSSTVRATTGSFGSICFGSLLVAIIQTLRALVESLRGNDDVEGCAAFLLCLVSCFLRCIEGMLEYFNKYAYIYVGMVSFTSYWYRVVFEFRGIHSIFSTVLSMDTLTSRLERMSWDFLRIKDGLLLWTMISSRMFSPYSILSSGVLRASLVYWCTKHTPSGLKHFQTKLLLKWLHLGE